MADIQSWMRKTIQPVRTRTPTFQHTHDERRSTSDVTSLPDSTAHRRRHGPRMKISSYFSYKPNKTLDDSTVGIWSSDDDANDAPPPDIGTMIDAIFIQLCDQPFDSLPEQMNKSVLYVIEAYRNLSVEKDRLDERLEEVTSRLEEGQKKWESEEEDFRAEIKRLELIIAKGKNGMSRLMASRQDSVVSRKRGHKTQAGSSTPTPKGTESVTNDGPPKRNIQRAISPSRKERALSIQLFSTGNHDLVVGTPPLANVSNVLGDVSSFSDGPKTSSSQEKVSLPHDGYSLHGSGTVPNPSGDIVSHERKGTRTFSDSEPARDFQAIKQMACAIAANRGLREEQILPKLIELFDNAEEHLEAPTGRATAGAQMRRPPSWVPNDDAAAGWRDQHAIPAIRPALRTIDSFASSHGGAFSDLSASSSDDDYGGERNIRRRPSKIPSPTHDTGLARSRQEQRSSVVTVLAGSGELLSSSAGSHATAFRNSAEHLDASVAPGTNMSRQMSQTSSRGALSASAVQGGATSSPDAIAAKSTTVSPR